MTLPHRRFTDEEEQQIKAIYEVGKFPSTKIARAYGCSPTPIISAVRHQGGKIRSHKRFTNNEEVEIAKIYAAGYSSVRIAEAYGCNYNVILNAVRRGGSTVRHVGCNTEHGKEKLSVMKRMFCETEDEEIRKIYKAGYTSIQISAAYRCDRSTILQALRRAGAQVRDPHLPGEDNPAWRGGTSNDPYPFEFDEDLRESVRDRDGRACQFCGMTEEENGKKLAVHHINYCKDDHRSSNLIALCKGCHSETNGHRTFWGTFLTQLMVKRGIGEDARKRSRNTQLFFPGFIFEQTPVGNSVTSRGIRSGPRG